MSDERFIDIETKLAHQEHTIAELNEVVTRQQQSLMTLERLCASMSERIASLSEASQHGQAADERPPHY